MWHQAKRATGANVQLKRMRHRGRGAGELSLQPWSPQAVRRLNSIQRTFAKRRERQQCPPAAQFRNALPESRAPAIHGLRTMFLGGLDAGVPARPPTAFGCRLPPPPGGAGSASPSLRSVPCRLPRLQGVRAAPGRLCAGVHAGGLARPLDASSSRTSAHPAEHSAGFVPACRGLIAAPCTPLAFLCSVFVVATLLHHAYTTFRCTDVAKTYSRRNFYMNAKPKPKDAEDGTVVHRPNPPRPEGQNPED